MHLNGLFSRFNKIATKSKLSRVAAAYRLKQQNSGLLLHKLLSLACNGNLRTEKAKVIEVSGLLENYYNNLHEEIIKKEIIKNQHPSLKMLGNSDEEIINNLDSISSTYENMMEMFKDLGVNDSIVSKMMSKSEGNSDMSLAKKFDTLRLGKNEYTSLKEELQRDAYAHKNSLLMTKWNDLERQKDVLVSQLEPFPELNMHMLTIVKVVGW